MEEFKRPKPEKDSEQEKLEEKIADLVAEALYEIILRKSFDKSKKGG